MKLQMMEPKYVLASQNTHLCLWQWIFSLSHCSLSCFSFLLSKDHQGQCTISTFLAFVYTCLTPGVLSLKGMPHRLSLLQALSWESIGLPWQCTFPDFLGSILFFWLNKYFIWLWILISPLPGWITLEKFLDISEVHLKDWGPDQGFPDDRLKWCL